MVTIVVLVIGIFMLPISLDSKLILGIVLAALLTSISRYGSKLKVRLTRRID
jgi:hypothetical protein